ncbi:MAG: sugar ABC transporter permease [Phycisphaerae bacterium]|nr:L-arabinose transport system permease protein AraQ [Phycisphaerales bacterium]MCK6476909.1 carbohydrate ABC transporter permease [Phycisphaerales bacterium]
MRGRRLQTLAVAASLAIASIITLLPFVWLACGSLKSNAIFFESLLLPRGDGLLGIDWRALTLDNYVRLFADLQFGRSLVLSVFYASLTSVLATASCAMGGYALARLPFRGSRPVTIAVLAAVLIPPPLLLAPGYQLLYHLNLLDTLSGMVLPALAPAFGVFLFRQAALSSVPRELLESARVDGSGELRTFLVVGLPLLRPMIGTFTVITFLGVWNNFITPQVVLQDPTKYPVSVAVASLRGIYYQDYGLQMAGVATAIVPLLIMFTLAQKDLVAGLTAGAVKG